MIKRLDLKDYAQQIKIIEEELFKNTLLDIYEKDSEITLKGYFINGKLVGFISFKDTDNIDIYNIGVLPNYRNKGVAKSLLYCLGPKQISVEVRESNIVAINFYKQNYFKQESVRKNYYKNENGLLMIRKKLEHRKAYAKINLLLNVLRKKENGFHEIEFINNSINIFDNVYLIESLKNEVIVTDMNLENNICNKVLDLIYDKFSLKKKYKVIIQKNIPLEAGLAGGSTDAAALLILLNKVEKLNLSENELKLLAQNIGSDVPYCVLSRLAHIKGEGEEVNALEYKIDNKLLVVINPGIKLSTKLIYDNHKIEQNHLSINEYLSSFHPNNINNELTKTACLVSEKFKDFYNEISSNYKNVLMSGSGSTILIFNESKEEQEQTFKKLRNKYDYVYMTEMR